MRIRISTKGRIVVPAKLRRRDCIKAGDQFEVERVRVAEYRLRRVCEPNGEGLVDWRLACPVKGYFVPIVSDSVGRL